jgi:hypothetical protein
MNKEQLKQLIKFSQTNNLNNCSVERCVLMFLSNNLIF